MRIAVAVLTYNQIENDREALFKDTVASLRYNAHGPIDLYVVDNGSTDGSRELVREMGGYCYTGSNTTSGHGRVPQPT